jgi:hypothetical protein
VDYDSYVPTMAPSSLACDGCGQTATPEHIARRLQRLEWTTRYRPVHVGTLLLSGVSPQAQEDFLYAGIFQGEAGRLLEAVGISPAGKSTEVVLSEFQRGGFLLTHVLECPLESDQSDGPSLESLLAQQISRVATRIRRSLKPKRVVLVSELLASVAARLSSTELGCAVVLDDGKPFVVDSPNASEASQLLRKALTASTAGM